MALLQLSTAEAVQRNSDDLRQHAFHCKRSRSRTESEQVVIRELCLDIQAEQHEHKELLKTAIAEQKATMAVFQQLLSFKRKHEGDKATSSDATSSDAASSDATSSGATSREVVKDDASAGVESF